MGNDKIDHESHDVDDEELDELMMKQLHQQRRPVHRRGDGYERKHIYRGAVVKQDENSDSDTDSDGNE